MFVERFWHFHENCKIKLDGHVLTAENDGSKIKMMIDGNSQIMLHRGNEVLPQGWVSRRYDDKVPAVTAVVTNRIFKTTSLMTNIQILSVA